MAFTFVQSNAPVAPRVMNELAVASVHSSAPLLFASSVPQSNAHSSKQSALAGLVGVCALGASGSKRRNRQKACRAAFDATAQEGVTEPFGFFDPLGFSKGKDEAGFRQLRVAEIKHGRVAMMASVGMVLPHFWKVPAFQEVPCGIGAAFTSLGGAGLAALFLGAGFHELVLWKDDANKDAGDFGDPFNFSASINVDRNYELNNGRMAMFAVLGQLIAELATGKDAVQQLGFN